jgi:transmembrane sensor
MMGFFRLYGCKKAEMIENNDEIWAIITSVLNDTASLDEKKRFASWINEHEENRKTYEVILSSGLKKGNYSQEVKNKIYSKVQNEILFLRYSHKLLFWKYSVAASIAIILSLASVLVYIFSAPKSSISAIETFCPNGNTSKILLSDGSTVYLNSGSSLSYPAKFTGVNRHVVLKGEGYFEVSKDFDHPFIVSAGEINIKVFGTHFNVKNYLNDKVIETTLLEGSVGIFDHKDKDFKRCLKLTPDQQAVYDRKSGNISKRKVDADLLAIWKEGKYYFENEKFEIIAKKLERSFNVSIKINSEILNDRVFSGLIDKNKNVFQILDIMKRYSKFNYTLNKDTIIINDK